MSPSLFSVYLLLPWSFNLFCELAAFHHTSNLLFSLASLPISMGTSYINEYSGVVGTPLTKGRLLPNLNRVPSRLIHLLNECPKQLLDPSNDVVKLNAGYHPSYVVVSYTRRWRRFRKSEHDSVLPRSRRKRPGNGLFARLDFAVRDCRTRETRQDRYILHLLAFLRGTNNRFWVRITASQRYRATKRHLCQRW